MTPRLLTKYTEEVRPHLNEQFQYKNVMEIPRLAKVVINIGVNEAKLDQKYMDASINELTIISLRSARMWEFVDRLFSIALPRIKDFQGISKKGFDGRGNFNLGLKEQLLFPEIDYDKVIRQRGMNITFVTTAKTDEEAMALLKELGMPFAR